MNTNELYMASRGGDEAAENRLFRHLAVRLQLIANLKIGNNHDAEEVVQDVLMTVAREYKQMEFRKSFRAWVYRIFDNKLLNYISAKKRQKKIGIEPLTENHASTAAQPDYELRARLLDCLSKLRQTNQRYARVLNLRSQGYGSKEICEELQISTQNLYMILSRARAMLKRCLDSGEVSP